MHAGKIGHWHAIFIGVRNLRGGSTPYEENDGSVVHVSSRFHAGYAGIRRSSCCRPGRFIQQAPQGEESQESKDRKGKESEEGQEGEVQQLVRFNLFK